MSNRNRVIRARRMKRKQYSSNKPAEIPLRDLLAAKRAAERQKKQ